MTEKVQIQQLAHRFLITAQQDLRAARCLYDNRYYPQAIFYLEQSVEKGLKSYSIALGIIDEKEAWHEISHKTLKIYEKSTKTFRQRVVSLQEKLKEIPQLETFFKQHVNFTKLLEQLDDSLNQIKSLLKQDERSLNMIEEELNKYIKILRNIERDLKQETEKVQAKTISPSEFRNTKKFLLEILGSAFANQPEHLLQAKEELNNNFTLESYDKITKDVVSQYIPPLATFQSFFQLSIILQPHAIARYPNSNFNPIEFYETDLPLLKSFVKLADITERVLIQVDKIYQKSEEVKHVPSI